MKINSNNVDDVTVQTLLKIKYPSLGSNQLGHNFYFMHRLDYATSGILCIPTNKYSCQIASKAMENKLIIKYYLALISGIPSKNLIVVDLPIGRDTAIKDIEKMCAIQTYESKNNKNAKTIIITLQIGLYDNYPATKVLIRPITGRRHQIRVHCSHIGHRIIGDYTYSNKKDIKPNRMFLHSYRLKLPNSLESLDVQTKDYFDENNVTDWRPLFNIHKLNDAFQILDNTFYN